MKINFAAGPSQLPTEVMVKAQQELRNYENLGISVMEMSHRSPEFKNLLNNTVKDLRDLLNIPNDYSILFQHGGGTAQFAAIPLNLLPKLGSTADYIVTGLWSSKAAKEGEKFANVNLVLPKTNKYQGILEDISYNYSSDANYLYYCDNETINGIEFKNPINHPYEAQIACDMSSNILTRMFDIRNYGIVFAGTQKNLGISGLCIVIIKDELIKSASTHCPSILDYKVTKENESLYNTPPCFAIYITSLYLKWIKSNGGTLGMEEKCRIKSNMIYNLIDNSNGFYHSTVDLKWRSRTNIPFRIGGVSGDDKLEKLFLEESKKRGMIQLSGHRSVGGLRASLYNGITIEDTEKLEKFMKEFLELYSK